jgi:hypothetical protein
MIHALDIPMCLWAKACLAIVYIMKRCPHRILKEKTAKEAFIGEKPQVANLHVFGCLVYNHIPDEKRTKLEPSSLKGLFVGYSKISKAYRVYIPSQQKVSKDVKFDKDAWSSKSRWLYKVKHATDGSIEKFKAQFVVRGFS